MRLDLNAQRARHGPKKTSHRELIGGGRNGQEKLLTIFFLDNRMSGRLAIVNGENAAPRRQNCKYRVSPSYSMNGRRR